MKQEPNENLVKEMMAKYITNEVPLLKLDNDEIDELERLEYEVVGDYDDEY